MHSPIFGGINLEKKKNKDTIGKRYTILHGEFQDMKDIKFLCYMKSRICYINQSCEEEAVLEGRWIDR